MSRQAEQYQLEALLATDKSPNSHNEFYKLGSFYKAMGHHEKAVPQFQACLKRREAQVRRTEAEDRAGGHEQESLGPIIKRVSSFSFFFLSAVSPYARSLLCFSLLCLLPLAAVFLRRHYLLYLLSTLSTRYLPAAHPSSLSAVTTPALSTLYLPPTLRFLCFLSFSLSPLLDTVLL